jgi:hypothetical protein
MTFCFYVLSYVVIIRHDQISLKGNMQKLRTEGLAHTWPQIRANHPPQESRKPRHLCTTSADSADQQCAQMTLNPNLNSKVLNPNLNPILCAEQQEQPCRAATVHASADLALAQHKPERSRGIPTSASGPRWEQAAQRRIDGGAQPQRIDQGGKRS